jgi:hypothetical protein
MKKVIRFSENQLSSLIKKVIKEQRTGRYMFFSNLEQIKRQCEILLELDEDEVTSILEHGHDWAQDHIAESKNNMDQVFDFIMNETKRGDSGMEMYEDDNTQEDEALAISMTNPNLGLAMSVNEGKKTGSKLCARGKSAAKSKFKVYPSAYANGYAVQVCKGRMPGLDGKKRCSGSYCKGK